MTLNVQEVGTGRPLVLLHGWLFNSGVWGPLVEPLSAHHRLYLIDLPGYGHNLEQIPSIYDIDTLAEMIDAVAPPDASVLAWSLGAMVALAWAVRSPSSVRSLMLIGATPRFTATTAWPHGISPSNLATFSDYCKNDLNETINRFIPNQTLGIPRPRGANRFLKTVISDSPLPAMPTLLGGLNILSCADLRPQLPRIRQPALIMHGVEDAVIPLAAGKTLADALPNARWEALPQSGHVPFIAHPIKVANRILEFCDEHP